MESSQTVTKALNALAVLAEAHEPLTVRELSSRAEISRGSTYRIINALEGARAIRRLSDGRVVLGDFLVQVASAVDYHPQLRMAAAGPMMDLRSSCDMETVGLYVRLNSAEMTCIEAMPGLHHVGHVEQLHTPVPIARGAVSLAFLALDLERYGREKVKIYLENLPEGIRPDDVELALDQALSVFDRGGVAPSMGVRIPHAASIACAIPAGRGRPVGVLSVSGTAQRFATQPTRQWGKYLKEAAVRISENLTGAPSY